MKKVKSLILVLFILFSLQGVTFAEEVANEPSVGFKVLDALVVRPTVFSGWLGLLSVYIVTAIPAHIIGYSEGWYQIMVEKPLWYFNERPLGEFSVPEENIPPDENI